MNDVIPPMETEKTVMADDSLQNLVSSLGTPKDKASHNQIVFSPIHREAAESMWRGTWLGRKCAEIIPNDMLRQWRTWEGDEKDVTRIKKIERKLKLKRKIGEALVYSRVFGGGAIYMGTGSAIPEIPLDLKSLKQGGLKFLHTFHRYELQVVQDSYERDIESPYFGLPMLFQLNTARTQQAQVQIHRSRLVIFDGALIPGDQREVTDGWGDSIFDAIQNAILNAASSTAGIASLIQEAKVDVIKVPGLAPMLETKVGADRVAQRYGHANMIKSLLNALVLDETEDYQTKTTSFSGLNETQMQFMQLVAGAADIPITRFLGQSPGGLSSTGESDLRNYYDNVKAKQEDELRQSIEALDEALLRSVGVWKDQNQTIGSNTGEADEDETEEITYSWAPLWQPTLKEKAEIQKTEAETINQYVNSGLVDTMVLGTGVKNKLIENGLLPGIKQAYEEHDAELESLLLEKELANEHEQIQLEGARKTLENPEPENANPER